MPTACSVEMKPQIMALGPMRAMRRVCEGARADSTPIWMPSEPRFANPHSAYDAMVKPRVESCVVRGHQRLQVQVRRKFVLDQFCREQLRDPQNIRPGHACLGRVREVPGAGLNQADVPMRNVTG